MLSFRVEVFHTMNRKTRFDGKEAARSRRAELAPIEFFLFSLTTLCIYRFLALTSAMGCSLGKFFRSKEQRQRMEEEQKEFEQQEKMNHLLAAQQSAQRECNAANVKLQALQRAIQQKGANASLEQKKSWAQQLRMWTSVYEKWKTIVSKSHTKYLKLLYKQSTDAQCKHIDRLGIQVDKDELEASMARLKEFFGEESEEYTDFLQMTMPDTTGKSAEQEALELGLVQQQQEATGNLLEQAASSSNVDRFLREALEYTIEVTEPCTTHDRASTSHATLERL